jgi:hypothetical protein
LKEIWRGRNTSLKTWSASLPNTRRNLLVEAGAQPFYADDKVYSDNHTDIDEYERKPIAIQRKEEH